MSSNLKNKITVDYWLTKLSDRFSTPNCSGSWAKASSRLVSNNALTYFHQLTQQKTMTEFTVLTTLYHLLQRKYFPEINALLWAKLDLEDKSNNALLFDFSPLISNTLRQNLQDVKKEVQTTFSHRHYTAADLEARLEGKTFAAFSPFGFSFLDPTMEFSGPLCDCHLVVRKNATADLELDLHYRTDFAPAHLVQHLLDYFAQLLPQMEELLAQKAEDWSLLSPTDHDRIFNTFNATTQTYPKTENIFQAFQQLLAKDPSKTIAKIGTQKLSVQQLEEQANQLAHHLRAQGIGPESIVPICLERSLDLLVAILGIWKAGAAYLPLDTQHPSERLQFIVADATAPIVLTKQKHADLFTDTPLLLLDQKHWQTQASTAPALDYAADRLAYVIYTSGTTGKPKGVLNEHGGLWNRLLWMRDALKVGAMDVLLQKTPYTFDVSVWELTLPLLTGAPLIFAEPEGHKDPIYLQQLMARELVSIVHFVPSMLAAFLEVYQPTRCDILQHVVCSGEALSPALAERFKQLLPYTQLHNLYGPTEAAIDVSYIDLTKVDTAQEGVSIGVAVPNTELYIVDQKGKLLPPGVKGELLIGGVQVARGYLNRPELTEAKFIPNPFATTLSPRLYRTGDLASWRTDGQIDFHGRIDHQVKIRGNRIELEEIENHLREFSPQLRQLTVVVREHQGEQVLVAYLVSQDIDKTKLRAFLADRLPDYMLPSFFVQLSHLPLNRNGKLDRKALPSVSSRDVIRHDYVAPTNELEQQLVDIWQDLLQLDRIGVRDNFFALGGHSLKATQMVNQIRERLGMELKTKVIFTQPTIQALATQLRKSEWTPIPRAKLQESYPLTAAQKRLWVLCQTEDGNRAYQMATTFQLRGKLSRIALAEALTHVVEQTEILRSSFRRNVEGEIRQMISPMENLEFQLAYRSCIGEKAKADQMIAQLYEQPFQLKEAPLFRVALFQTEKEEYLLSLMLHHLVGDGWSVELLMQKISEAYEQRLNGEELTIEDSLQYKDYAQWLSEKTITAETKKAREFWLDHLSGDLPVLDLPIFKTRPRVKGYRGHRLTQHWSIEQTEALTQFAQEQQATLFMTLLAGVNALLYRYTNQNDIILGIPVAGREHPQLEKQIGLMLNTLALRTAVDGQTTWTELVAQQKAALLAAYEHQAYPLDEIIEELSLKPDPSRSPLFEVMIVLHNQKDGQVSALSLAEVNVKNYETVAREISHFDLTFEFYQEANQLQLALEYNSDLYDQAFVEQLARHLKNFFHAAIEQKHSPIATIPILSTADYPKKQNPQLPKINRATSTTNLIDRFEEQVRLHPENPAIVFGEGHWTYQELEETANQLAHFLLANYAIQKGDLILVQLERSDWLIVSILAVLKTGAAYIPLDPQYPPARVDFIIEDSGGKLMIDEQLLETFRRGKANISRPPKVQTTTSDLAYVIYTSGTTGQPKGVMIEQHSLLNLCDWHQLVYEVGPQSRQTLFASIAFDASVWEIFPALLSGACLYPIPNDQLRYDGQALADFLQKEVITHSFLPPTIVAELVDLKVALPQLCILTGGDVLRISPQTKLRIYNNYGPTENTVVTTYFDTSQPYNGRIPIGRPIANTEVYILSADLQLQAAGVVGELCIAGAGLARGYLNRPALNASKFIPHPFAAEQRLYRTGDLARRLPDGNIDFIGRRDGQVKIRGYRIELEEIEQVLHRIAEVQQALVQTYAPDGDPQLVAYLLTSDKLDRSSLRDQLSEHLPDYMIPAYFVLLSEIPLSAHGKINYAQLPTPGPADLAQRKYLAPRNAIETRLAELWAEVLQVERVGVRDSFFELGGHSLKATRLLSQINQEFGVAIDLRKIFTNPTIAALALEIENTNWLTQVKQQKEIKKIII